MKSATPKKTAQGSVKELQPAPQVADLIISYLEQIGVEYVFGVPGGAIEPLYNAMARSQRRGGLRPIVARHETGAAFMADGYARETGKLGVCCATTGPGATNLITGVASAYADNIPMLVITAQTPLHTFGKGALQESCDSGIDIMGMFQQCTRYNSLVSHVEQMELKLVAATIKAFHNPKGPVHLSIPGDVFKESSIKGSISFRIDNFLRQLSLSREDAVDELYNIIHCARNIVFLVGDGCGEAISLILKFAELVNASIVTTPYGKGLVNSYHPRYKGVFGFSGHASAYNALTDPEVDLVLATGTDMGELETNGWDDAIVLNDKLVHIDPIIERLARSPMARLHICDGIFHVFESLMRSYYKKTTNVVGIASHRKEDAFINRMFNDKKSDGNNVSIIRNDPPDYLSLDDKRKCLDDSTPIKPQRLMMELSKRFPLSTRFFADSGNSVSWAIHYLSAADCQAAGVKASGGGIVKPNLGTAAMTWAIGAAIGTAFGSPKIPVVCITGDASFLMGGQELTVAVMEKLTVIFVVLNDGALGMVKHGQRLTGAEQVGFELPSVNFCMLAHAQGAQAFKIHSPQDFAALDIEAICAHPGPTLLDVYIDPEEVPPMGMRIKTLNNALTKPTVKPARVSPIKLVPA